MTAIIKLSNTKVNNKAEKVGKRPSKKSFGGLAYVLPSLIILTLIAFVPIVCSIALSFTEYDVLSDPQFNGVHNYQVLWIDSFFWQALKYTLVFTIFAVPVQLIIAMLLADRLAKMRPRWFSGLVRSVLFVPVVASIVLVGAVWRYMLASDFGFFNTITKTIGLGNFNFLGDEKIAMASVIVVSVWKNVGYFLVLFYAGVMNIPLERYEAAKVDGANSWQQFWYITVPGLRPITVLCVILSTIWSFQVFDLVYAMTGGGPGGATSTLVMAVYQAGLKQFQMGYASAMAMVLLAITILCAVLQKLLMKGDETC